jgi:hypothetical protein
LVEGGLTAELRAAGLSSKPSPMVVLVFLASAVFGGLAVWLVTREPAPVVIESLLEAPPPEPSHPAVGAVAEEKKTVAETTVVEEKKPVVSAVVDEKKPTSRADRNERNDRTEKKKKEREREPTPSRGGGVLVLESVPRGLTVVRGDDVLGKTPLSATSLPAGKHTLKLSNKAFGISKTISVEIKRGERTEQSITVGRGTLKVLSRPWADVFINGVAKGKTPLDTPVYEGMHEVRLVNPEAGERIQKVDVKSGEEKEVKVRF